MLPREPALDSQARDGSSFTAFLAGARRAPAGTPVPLVNPATGRRWGTSFVDPGAVDPAVTSAADAFRDGAFRALAAHERGTRLRRLGDLIAAHAEELAMLETLANGKPLASTISEMRATAQWYHFFAGAAETRDDRLRQITPTADACIVREPYGVVVAITPFNAALSLGSWKMTAALAAGNTVVLKPPAEAPGSTVRLAELALKAGFPPGVVNVVIGDATVGEALATHEKVAMVSFTGSTAAARRLGGLVGGRLTRFSCEAGGKSAHLVFEDADVDAAVVAATQGAFTAAGQTCVAGSRVLVHERVYDEFLRRYAASAGRLRIGDPLSPRTHVGPVASRRQLDRIAGFVRDAVARGATVLVGGRSPVMEGPLEHGFWFEPTILVDVSTDMPVCREEVFGPVATVQAFRTEDEAIALANGTDYGLAAGFWTRDVSRVRRVSRRLEAGVVWVNTYRLIHRLVPFGGCKQSGLGRENGVEALDEFTQIKSIVVDHAPPLDPFAD